MSHRALPFLPLRHGVILPGAVSPIPVGRDRSVALAKKLAVGQRLILGVQYESIVEEPAIADVHPIGVLAEVRDIRRGRRGTLVVETLRRVALRSIGRHEDYWRAEYDEVNELNAGSDAASQWADSLRDFIKELAVDKSLHRNLDRSDGPGRLADRVANFVDLPREAKLEVLHELDVANRLEFVADALKLARASAELRDKINSEVRRDVTKQQREAMLRQQLRAIQNELGDGDDDELADLRQRLDDAELPEEAAKIADREFGRLQSMQGGQAEGHVIRKYLEWLADLPWNKRSETSQSIDAIAATLDEDHHGLEEPKKRILEHMAVLKLAAEARGTILALVGPPGVGKTSLAQSVARATGRPLARVSLGGVRDEAEIRGHRRTYVGALPGRILNALRQVGVKNPVMVLDEVDKLGRGWAGDPEAALLEVLDPEQNENFTDHYTETPFDLSEVLFIATANDITKLSAPLRDRLEIIEVSGYTMDEKIEIGRRHLWPVKLEKHGLSEEQVELSDEALTAVVRDYTREAGVRQLGRELAKVCRDAALHIAKDASATRRVDLKELRKILGRPKFLERASEKVHQRGVAAGLAWTPVGGEVLYVETTKMPGKGRVEITGQLGDVMNESAKAALAYLRSHAADVDADPLFMESHDLHIHVPAGGVPKDGPSAGVTMFTALASLLSGRLVRPDTAMTGEATLRGRVLPVGGIKSKVLAAHRAGYKRVILPKRNESDLEDIPESVRDELEVILAEDMHEVLGAALEEQVTPANGNNLGGSSEVSPAALA